MKDYEIIKKNNLGLFTLILKIYKKLINFY